MRPLSLTSSCVLSFLFVASPVFAQPRWTAELRGGVNLAADTFAVVDLETGAGLEVGLGVRVARDLFVYGAWDWQNRAAKAGLFGVAADVEDTGYAFGVRYVAPLSGRATPWVRVGACSIMSRSKTKAPGISSPTPSTPGASRWGVG